MDASEICRSIDNDLIYLIHNIVLLIKIAVPIVLVILGMIDFAKGVIASKEDEIKKGQQTFFKRVIAAIIVFFIVTIVQLLMSFVSDDGGVWTCANQILNGVPNPEVSEKVDDKNTENKGTEQKQTQTKEEIDNDTNNVGAIPDNKCIIDNEYMTKEYQYCLTKTDKNLCNSVFQSYCTNDLSYMWKKNDNYFSDTDSEAKLYQCKGQNVIYNSFYEVSLYYCATSGPGLDKCVSLFSEFCQKK